VCRTRESRRLQVPRRPGRRDSCRIRADVGRHLSAETPTGDCEIDCRSACRSSGGTWMTPPCYEPRLPMRPLRLGRTNGRPCWGRWGSSSSGGTALSITLTAIKRAVSAARFVALRRWQDALQTTGSRRVSPQIQRFLRSEPNVIRKIQEGLVLFVDCDLVHAHYCRCESVREPDHLEE
jgi:hypothetical protein